jgi:thiol-disulfide isomerase/thioredoxin
MRLWPSLFLLTFSILGCSAPGGTEVGTATNSTVAAPDFELTDIHGKKFALKDFRGKVVFLDFWATWCPPCIMSIPEVGKLHADYASKDVEVISISLDNDVSSVLNFVSKHHMSNRVAMALDSGIDTKYHINGIPAFFIINKQGKLANIWEGYNPQMTTLWRKQIDRLLGA